MIWNGNGGKTIFFQNEKPYDVPDQATWRGGANGYAAYKVADNVTSHEAWSLGSYTYFNVNPAILVDRAFEMSNTAGVRFYNMVTVSLNNQGGIDHINNTGAAVPVPGTNTAPSCLVNYPTTHDLSVVRSSSLQYMTLGSPRLSSSGLVAPHRRTRVPEQKGKA